MPEKVEMMAEPTEQKQFQILFKEMKKRTFMPFVSCNRPIIEKFFPEIKAKFPQAKVFYFSKHEYVCLTSEAEYYLTKYLEERIESLKTELEESKKTLATVKKGGK